MAAELKNIEASIVENLGLIVEGWANGNAEVRKIVKESTPKLKEYADFLQELKMKIQLVLENAGDNPATKKLKVESEATKTGATTDDGEEETEPTVDTDAEREEADLKADFCQGA